MPHCPSHPQVALVRVKKGWYCEECDRCVLGREDVAATGDAPGPALALDTLPFPIAHPLHFAREATLPPADRLTNLTFAAYQAMRLATLLLLAEHLEAPAPSRRVATALTGQRMPHWQEWSQLYDALAKHWRGDFPEERPAGPSRFPTLVSGWLEINRSKAAPDDPWASLLAGLPGLGVPQARSLNEAIWRMRNDRAHRLATRTDPADDEALLARFQPVVEAFIARLFPPGALRLVRAAEDGQVLLLHGPHPDLAFTPEPAGVGWEVALDPTGLAALSAGPPLAVYPLLTPDADEDTGAAWEPALLVDGVRPRHLLLLGVRSHGTSTAHLSAFTAALERKRVDFGLRRADVKPWTVVSWARATAAEELAALRDRKYFPACYVARAGVDDLVERRLQAPGRGLLLLGEAGAGKSSLMCHLVARLLAEGQGSEGDVVLFLSGRAAYEGAPHLPADQLLADALCRRAAIRPGSFRDARALVEHLAGSAPADTQPGRRTWILLDALNEAERFTELLQAVDRLLPTLEQHPWLRLVLTLRSGAFRSLERRGLDLGRAEEGVFHHQRHLHTFHDPGSEREQPWLTLRPFREDEVALAYQRRQVSLPERACPTPWERLAPGLQGLLRAPLHLHVFHESFHGSDAASAALDEARLFGAYLDTLERGLPALAETLGAIGRYLLEARRPDLPAEVADGWVQAWRESQCQRRGAAAVTARLDPMEQLVSASVLLRPAHEGFGSDRRVAAFTFVHQALCEQVLLRELERRMAPRRLPTPEELLAWARLAAGGAERGALAELAGALEILAARCVHAGEGAPLAALLELEDRPTRTAVLGSAVRALGAVWGQEEGGSRAARAVMAVLRQAGSAGTQPGSRLASAVSPARSWLEQSGHSRPAGAILALQVQVVRAQVGADPGSTELRRELAAGLGLSGNKARDLGRGEEARRRYEESLEVMRALVAAHPERADLQRELFVSLSNLGQLAADTGQGDAARRHLEEALGVMRALVAAHLERTDLRRDLCVALTQLATLSRAAGRNEEALGLYRESLQALRGLLEREPHRADLRRELSVTLNHLGVAAQAAGLGDEARRCFAESLQVMRTLVAAEPHRTDLLRDLAVALDHLGSRACVMELGADKRRLLEESLRVKRALVAAEPHRADLRMELAATLGSLGTLERSLGRSQEAHSAHMEALRLIRGLLAAEPSRVDLRRRLAITLKHLGELERAAGRGAEAARCFQEALQVMRALVTAEPHRADLGMELSAILNVVGSLAQAAGQADVARGFFQESVQVMRAIVATQRGHAEAQRHLAIALDHLGILARTTGRRDEARRIFTESLGLLRPLVEAEPQRIDLVKELCVCLNELGNLEEAEGHLEEARRCFEESLQLMRGLVQRHPARTDLRRELSAGLNSLASLMGKAGRPDLARGHFDEALQLLRALVADEPQRADLRLDLATVLWNRVFVCSAHSESNPLLYAMLETLHPLRGVGQQHPLTAKLCELATRTLRGRGLKV